MSDKLSFSLFRWLVGLAMVLIMAAFSFQQNEISNLEGKIDGFQLATNNRLSVISEDVAGIKEGISWIKEALKISDIYIKK